MKYFTGENIPIYGTMFMWLQHVNVSYERKYRTAGNFRGKSEKALRGFKFRGSNQFRGVAPGTSDDVIGTHARSRSRSSSLLLQN